MRRLIWLVAILTAVYGGYWVVGSRAALKGAEAALAQMKAEGLADYGTVSIAGFPSRFDLTVTNPDFRSPDQRWGWSADFLQVLALSYRPNHVIAALPDRQALQTPLGPATLDGTGFRASAVFGADSQLPLDHAQLVSEAATLAAKAGWGLETASLRAAIRRAGDSSEAGYDVALELPGAIPQGSLADWLSPLAVATGATGRAVVKARITLDRPLDRQGGQRRLQSLDVSEAELFWGRIDLAATGSLSLGPDGTPEGRIDLSARNWAELVEFAAGNGLIDPRTAPTVGAVLGQLALASGDATTLRVPLVFAGGRMSLGPVPLGPAPRF